MLNFFRNHLWRFPKLQTILRVLRGHHYVLVPPGHQPIYLDYPVRSEPRYGNGKPSHALLRKIIARDAVVYERTITDLLHYAEELMGVPVFPDATRPEEPNWVNGLLPNFDGLAIYGFLAQQERRNYFEVGSGNSTKFARKAIRQHNYSTRILSLDPEPRAAIDSLCDEVVRQPLEKVDLAIFDRLGADDILLVDNSHRSFMNSDVTVFFLDVLPRLHSGVLVGIHDIFLPDDYPPQWGQKYFSEQYLLACSLLGGGQQFDLVLPASFCTRDPDFLGRMTPAYLKVYSRLTLKDYDPQPHGCACWFRVR